MPASPSPYRIRWLAPVLVVIVCLTVAGGLIAREVYRAPDATEQPQTQSFPTGTPLPPDQQPGPATVELSPDAAAHPLTSTVRPLLQTYFDAINERDYDRWRTVVTTRFAQQKPRAEWQREYQTTRDGSIRLYRVDTAANDGLRALVAFTSTQDVAHAPVSLQEPCIKWRIAMPVVLEVDRWKLDSLPATTTPEQARC